MAGRAVHVKISGRVQGVSYRAWVETEAQARDLDGWVRNRRDGSVEAVFSGDEDVVNEMVAACWRGPPAAVVQDVAVADYSGAPLTGFEVLLSG